MPTRKSPRKKPVKKRQQRICVEATAAHCPGCDSTDHTIRSSHVEVFDDINQRWKYEYRKCASCPQVYVVKIKLSM